MMKSLRILVLCAVAGAVAAVAGAQVECEIKVQVDSLTATSGAVVGRVSVFVQSGQLCVRLKAKGDWQFSQTHVAAAGSPDGIPQSGSGEPLTEQFPLGGLHAEAENLVRYCLPYTVSAGTPIYLATQAVARRVDSVTGAVTQEETAWSGPSPFPGATGARYMVFTPVCGVMTPD